MTDETPDVVSRARAALDGITPGRWRLPETLLGIKNGGVFSEGKEVAIVAHTRGDADGRFIAASPDLVRDLVAEVEKARRAARTLGKVIDRQALDALHAIGQDLGGELINADGDGDWGAVWDLLGAIRPARDRAIAEADRLRRANARLIDEKRTLEDENDRLEGDAVRLLDERNQARAERDRDCAEMVRLRGEVERLTAERDQAHAAVDRVRKLATNWHRCTCDPGLEGQHREDCLTWAADELDHALDGEADRA
ncbi:hypothetical protein [Gordonia malaquae]|uniref:hypothetical protein n=1 Tax=Gordonia malaquae TaxID=410332 RepID=UPI00301A8457